MSQRLVTQECLSCHRILPLEEFHLNGNYSNGHLKRCKRCVNDKRRKPGSLPRNSRQENGDRRCSQCRSYLPEEDFLSKGKGGNGQSWVCPECYPKYTREIWYRHKYGIEYEEFRKLWSIQEERCAVCREETETPCLDHSHDNGRIRGVLCPNCNRAAGLLQDDPIRIGALLLYLRKEI